MRDQPGSFPEAGPFSIFRAFLFQIGCRTMASCVFRRFSPCFCRAFPVEWKTNSSQFAFLENAVGVSRPEVREKTLCVRPIKHSAVTVG